MNHQEAAYDHHHGLTAAEERETEDRIDDRAADIADGILADHDQFESLLYELLACRIKRVDQGAYTTLQMHRHRIATEALNAIMKGHPTALARIMRAEALQEGRRRAEIEHEDGI